ncbi:organic solute transporter alpha-like protein 3 [Harpegnathos saltator]|uniref:Organic solute transporter alpha-like protein n=1 Tax=Harpegnathos saltator TaxID=610380 RepID=E2BDK8_HARSA|nr:organic solute transporter alpha-like protein 3 [Harpegnathos saltator]EFN86223.1 Organic solute transporter alpha-like protein [Harpegnathos saltator]
MEQNLAAIYCDRNYMPSAIEHMESLNGFGIGLLTVGSILSILTLYFAADACHNVRAQKDSKFYKANVIVILSVYPVASICSLTAIAIPRGQLLSEAVTQVFLTISLYRLYLLLLDVGRRKITETPSLILRVGPCCCWPCLPFPSLEMTDANLSWLGILALQLPIVQSLLYFINLLMAAEDPIVASEYSVYLQPFVVVSILLGLYSISITTKSLHAVAPEAKLHLKTLVSQLVLLCSKLQASIVVKGLPASGLFPCNPPLTPEVYANVTLNSLMLIEMLLLCCAARHLYYVDLEKDQEPNTSDWPKTTNLTDSTHAVNNSNGSDKQPPATTPVMTV